jgi:hypothetical protein
MAILNPNKPGYAVVEINKLESRTTGNMVANAPLATDFTTNGKEGAEQTYAENGMILFHDPTSKKGNRYGAIVGYAGAGEGSGAETLTPTSFGLVYATEHMYDTYSNALQNFKMDRPTDPDKEATPYEAIYGQQNHFQYYPRLYMLSSSDTFTTDAIDLGDFDNIDDVRDAVADGRVYVDVQEGGGYSVLSATQTLYKTYGVVEMVTTLPDGITPAIKIRVIGNDIKFYNTAD